MKPEEETAGALEPILMQIEQALEVQLWYAALSTTLQLPDICSLVELPPEDAWSKRSKYAAWFDRYMGQSYQFFTGDDCYNVRGGVLHKGQFGHHESRYDRVAFTIGSFRIREQYMGQNEIGGEKLPSFLSMDLALFCTNMIDCVRVWYDETKDQEHVRANLANVVRLRPEGLPPYVGGMPLIA